MQRLLICGFGDIARRAAPALQARFDIRDLAPGVHLLVNLRAGFHMLFVEFADHVLAVDAPAGWHELHQLPASGLSAEGGSAALGSSPEATRQASRQALSKTFAFIDAVVGGDRK